MLCTFVAHNGRKKGFKMPCKFFKQDEKFNNNNKAKINMAGVCKI